MNVRQPLDNPQRPSARWARQPDRSPAEGDSPSRALPLSCRVTDLSSARYQTQVFDDSHEILDSHRPDWSEVRWIHLQGSLPEPFLEALANKYHIHPIACEDLRSRDLRPKLEDFPGSRDLPGRLFIVVRELSLCGGVISSGQIALFLGRNTLLTMQATPSDVFDPVYRRLEFDQTRERLIHASMLCHALIDCLVDSYFPILEFFSHRLDAVEEGLMGASTPEMIAQAHQVKRGLLMLRRTVWPMREVVSQLQRDGHGCLLPASQPYFRDIYEHCVQLLDLNETYHEIAVSLTEAFISVVSNRMNEVVKVLTIISTIFMPLSFIAAVYGMNMPIPENHSEYAYPIFWLVCLVISGGMLVFFRRRGWL